MNKSGMLLAAALAALTSAAAASSHSAGVEAKYRVDSRSMIRDFQHDVGQPLVMHQSKRRLKSVSADPDHVAMREGSIVDVTGQALMTRLGRRLKARSSGNQASLGIDEGQQLALSRLATDMPDQAAGFRAYFDQKTMTPSFVKFTAKAPRIALRGDARQMAKASSRQFLNEYRELLKIDSPDDEFSLVREQSDPFGNRHFRYQHTVDGIPVWGSELMVHLREDNSAYLLNGRFQSTIKIDTTPSLTEAEAEERVKQALEISWVSGISSELMVYPMEHDAPRLAYKVDVLPALTERWLYFIDAHSGDVLHRISYNQQVSVNASGADLFGNAVSFRAWQDGANYFMVDTELPTPGTSADPIANSPASGDTIILDARNGEGDTLYFSTSDSLNSGWDPTAVTVMDHIVEVYDYYKATFNRDSIDDAGKNLIAVVHLGQNRNTAFWNGNLMAFGDGDGQLFNSLALCDDVAAHELTHGVVGATAALRYENQSGALNEAYADIFAAMVDRDDWTMGEDCTAAAPGHLRNMADPKAAYEQQPTRMSEYVNLPNTEQGDWGGVHVNNSIPAHAAYLMAEGLSVKGLGTSFGREKTEQIWYRALTTYLTASSQFIDARHATLQAAEDLYGTSSPETTAVGLAWDIVEVTDNGSTPADPSPTDTDPVTGDDLMVYIFPNDNGFNSLYAQIMNDPLAYDAALDKLLRYSDADISAKISARPAAYTDEVESVVFFVGEDENLHAIDISQISSASPMFTRTQLTDTGGVWGVSVAPNASYFAFTTSNLDKYIYVGELATGQVFSYEITPPDFSDDNIQGTASTVLYADAMAFDYNGRYLTFDALNCISTETSSCDANGGYRYWSIGVMDVTDGSVFYPVASQSPNLDVGFPSFAQNNNYVIAVDVIDYSADVNNPSSRVVALNFETQQSALLHDFGSDSEAHFGVPSFWGDDQYLTILLPDSNNTYAVRKTLNTNGDGRWEAANSAVEQINLYPSLMPVMHRAGQRNNTGRVSPSTTQVNFGAITVNEQDVADLVLSNTGNNDVNITNVQMNGNEFFHNGTNVLLPRNGSVSWALSFNPASAGAKTGVLTITTDSTPETITVSLTGTGVASGGGDDGSGNDGSNDDSGSSDDDADDGSGGGAGQIGGGFLFILLIMWISAYRTGRAAITG